MTTPGPALATATAPSLDPGNPTTSIARRRTGNIRSTAAADRHPISASPTLLDQAQSCIAELVAAVHGGLDPVTLTTWLTLLTGAASGASTPTAAYTTLADYGTTNMALILRGLQTTTHTPYLSGWRLRVLPTLGHLPLHAITRGVIDRTVHSWIADSCGRSTVKNSLAILVRVLEQAVRDDLLTLNPAHITGWQKEYQRAEDELTHPRALALEDWNTLTTLADALVDRSHDHYPGWGDVVRFCACTAARIGEASGVRVKDIDTTHWIWTARRQTTPGPGGLIDKATKGRQARKVPIIAPIRPMITRHLQAAGPDPHARLFTGPRGGRIATAVLRDATHWDDVVTHLGLEHLTRHDLRHTGLTWMADAGIPLHVLRLIAGHAHITTTQHYLHPNHHHLTHADTALTHHLNPNRPVPNAP